MGAFGCLVRRVVLGVFGSAVADRRVVCCRSDAGVAGGLTSGERTAEAVEPATRRETAGTAEEGDSCWLEGE